MSTRSVIIVKVRKEDIGKEMKFNEAMLPVPLDNWDCKDLDGNVYRKEGGKNLCKPVVINEQYLAIYCHWDGYPSGVGAELKEHFTDYQKALNLVIGGSVSALDSRYVRHYANRQGEKWDYLKPTQGKTQKEVLKPFDWSEYAYLFDEARGGWVYKPLTFRENDKTGFKAMPVKK